MTDIEAKTLDLRLDAARSALGRKQFAFLTATIVSLTIMIAGWNAYFSSYRDFAWAYSDLSDDHKGKSAMQQELLTQWIHGRFISIAPLGISVGVDDASVLGALALFIISLWHFLTTRRENHLIGSLLHDYEHADCATQLYVYHGVHSYLLLNSVSRTDFPIFCALNWLDKREELLVRLSVKVLYFLPVIALALMLVLDVSSAFAYSTPIRKSTSGGHDWYALSNLWDGIAPYGLAVEIFKWLFGIVFLVMLFTTCSQIHKFAFLTDKNIARFHDRLIARTNDAGRVEPIQE